MGLARNVSLTERENLDHGAVGLVGGEDCATENNGNRPAIPGDLMGYLFNAFIYIWMSQGAR